MKVIFYRTTSSGSKKIGEISNDGGELSTSSAQDELDFLLENVDPGDAKAVDAALRRAPIVFDGAYLRAEVVG